MIHVAIPWLELSSDAMNEYAYWALKAEACTKAAIQRWEAAYPNPVKDLLDAEIWTEHKVWLSKYVFYHKCAYCEKSIRDQKYDMEHFRPKGSVRARSADGEWKKAVIQDPEGKETKHPGYFWLAYDVDNLMPACDACNSSSETGLGAKSDRFPVSLQHMFLKKLSDEQAASMEPAPWKSGRWSGYYYLRPKALDSEEDRGVINPLFDEPALHVRFIKLGQIDKSKLTDIGRFTVDVLKLDRKQLETDRWTLQNKTYIQVLALMDDVDAETYFPRIKPSLERYLKGQLPFSAAVLDYIEQQEAGTPFGEALRRERAARTR
jgi:hypothetical protein